MKLKLIILITTIIMIFIGCSSVPSQSIDEEISGNLVEQSDNKNKDNPKKAIEEIYKDIDIMDIESADSEVLEEKFSMDTTKFSEFYVNYSAGNYGLADVFIIRPFKDSIDDVYEMLDNIKKQRIEEFQNYIIFNSLSIAQNAEIYTQGDYVVMIMLDDDSNAKDIINKYINN